MITITTIVVLPLSLTAKKLDRLSRASAFVLAFYFLFVIYVSFL